MKFRQGQVLSGDDVRGLPTERWLCRLSEGSPSGSRVLSGFMSQFDAQRERTLLSAHVDHGEATVHVQFVDNRCVVLHVERSSKS